MRIVLDATPLLGERTGIGRYTAHLLAELPAALARAGVDAGVAAATWTLDRRAPSDVPPGVEVVGAGIPPRLLWAAWRYADRPVAEQFVGPCDVIHSTNFVSPPARHAREVVTIHDLSYELQRETVSPASRAYRRLVPRALGRGAQVLAISETMAGRIRDFYGLPDERVAVTRLGVDESWYAEPRPTEETLRRLGIPPRYLLFVGSLDRRKNLPRLVAAHRAATAAGADVPPLVLAGPAGRESGLADHPGVLLAGFLDDADLRATVAGCTALVLPSLDEGFGLPVLESLACGRPVVVSDVPALREVAGPYGVVVPPQDEDAIAAGLLAVLGVADDDDARRARRSHARGWTWQGCAESTVRAYLMHS